MKTRMKIFILPKLMSKRLSSWGSSRGRKDAYQPWKWVSKGPSLPTMVPIWSPHPSRGRKDAYQPFKWVSKGPSLPTMVPIWSPPPPPPKQGSKRCLPTLEMGVWRAELTYHGPYMEPPPPPTRLMLTPASLFMSSNDIPCMTCLIWFSHEITVKWRIYLARPGTVRATALLRNNTPSGRAITQ